MKNVLCLAPYLIILMHNPCKTRQTVESKSTLAPWVAITFFLM